METEKVLLKSQGNEIPGGTCDQDTLYMHTIVNTQKNTKILKLSYMSLTVLRHHYNSFILPFLY